MFNDKEISNQDGRVAALYLLEWGKTRWRYTSADRPIDVMEYVDGVLVEVTYEPRALKDSGMVQGSSSQNDFTIDGPSDLPIVRLFRGSPPSESIWLTVRRKHFDEADAPIYWKGTVWNVKRPTEAKCQIIGKPLSASLKRTGLRLCWSRECPHFIYDDGCKVDPEAYRIDGTLLSVAGTTLTISLAEPPAPDYYLGGIISWQASDEGTIERRMIEAQVQSDLDGTEATILTIFGLVDFIEIGDAVALYPGCSRTPEICDTRFGNIDNYGGFDKMPGASPFNTAIW
jgi:uncharacterized phage protein (TIGR02218 family)